MTTTPDVQPGQVWIDNDPRLAGTRKVRVLTVDTGYATVENLDTGRKTQVRLHRFRPTSTGYRLQDPQ